MASFHSDILGRNCTPVNANPPRFIIEEIHRNRTRLTFEINPIGRTKRILVVCEQQEFDANIKKGLRKPKSFSRESFLLVSSNSNGDSINVRISGQSRNTSPADSYSRLLSQTGLSSRNRNSNLTQSKISFYLRIGIRNAHKIRICNRNSIGLSRSLVSVCCQIKFYAIVSSIGGEINILLHNLISSKCGSTSISAQEEHMGLGDNSGLQLEGVSIGTKLTSSESRDTSDSQNSENTQNFFHFSFLSEPFVRVQVTFDGYNVLSLRTYVNRI